MGILDGVRIAARLTLALVGIVLALLTLDCAIEAAHWYLHGYESPWLVDAPAHLLRFAVSLEVLGRAAEIDLT
jgi:hypothetical protein